MQELKYGDHRGDGFRFLCYKNVESGKKPVWLSEVSFQKDRERKRIGKNKWRKENQDRQNLYNKKYYNKNCESEKLRTKEWAIQNPDKVKLYKQKYSKIHSETCVNRVREWRKSNPEIFSSQCSLSASKRGNAKVDLDPFQIKIIKEIYKARKRIENCTSILHHVDHIIPIAKGGKHTPANLQILSAVANLKKGVS